jgi:hypothetical protein
MVGGKKFTHLIQKSVFLLFYLISLVQLGSHNTDRTFIASVFPRSFPVGFCPF